MTGIIVHTFDFIRQHKRIAAAVFLIITLMLGMLVMRQTYKEDISDFLPHNSEYGQAMDIYRRTAGGERIIGVVELRDTTRTEPDRLCEALDDLKERIETAGELEQTVKPLTQVDVEQMSSLLGFVYRNMPLFLDPDQGDYERMEQQLDNPDFVGQQLVELKQTLMLPGTGMMTERIENDPLNLFAPVVDQLQGRTQSIHYELYDSHFFSPDLRRAFILMDSPFGSSETEQNGRLLAMLDSAAVQTMAEFDDTNIHFTGGPVIAVGNARQIKQDSMIAVALAAVIILLLLFTTLRSPRNILLIALSIGWGWLFAMGGLALVHNNVSIIVIGISSIIIGIAVNYPLHMVAHLRHTPDRRQALREIVSPLVVGNITTVGAFLALVPLKSVAMRDLGLFAAFLLVGTILFVLILLPHLAKVENKGQTASFIDRLGNFSLENKRWLGITVAVATVVLAYFSLHTKFDPDFSHINYMDDQQRTDMTYLQQMTTTDNNLTTLYVVTSDSTADGLLDACGEMEKALAVAKADSLISDASGCAGFITSRQTQQARLQRWNQFVKKYGEQIKTQLRTAAERVGFSVDAFSEFVNLLDQDFQPQDISFFEPLTKSLFSTNLLNDSLSGQFRAVDVAQVRPGEVKKVRTWLETNYDGKFLAFDIKGLNSAVANSLSDNFNYIGWACGLIVFLFLWFSFGNLELAILSFLPMAVSWIWILGLMAIFDIHFNVVNIILATFIFGQGDDYTIFMTEGCQYEYATRKKVLGSYKSSIILSALIMFVGIGALIFARHPALHSLAVLTILGMFSVVLMAYLFPPLIFQWLVKKNGEYRLRPLSLKYLNYRVGLGKDYNTEQMKVLMASEFVKDRYRFKGQEVMRAVRKTMRKLDYYFYNVEPKDDNRKVVVINSGYGQFALAYSLMHKEQEIITFEPDAEKVLIARYSAEGVTDHISVHEKSDADIHRVLAQGNIRLFLLNPSEEEVQKYKDYQPEIINC